MATKAVPSVRSSNWLFAVAILGVVAIAAFLMSKQIDDAVGNVVQRKEPALNLPLEPVTPQVPVSKRLSREEESWDRIQLGSLTLELPGDPIEDPKPGWFSQYPNVQTLAAYRVPVEHRNSHIRVSLIHNSSGKISLQAASLATKHGMESDFSGVTTIYPFNFRDLPSRHISTRPIDLDDLTRMHTYLVINNDEMLILTVTGHDRHPSRLAFDVLKTIELP